MPILRDIFESFSHASSCGMSESLEMLLDSIPFVIAFRVVSGLRLASSVFGFKLSQLRGVLDTHIREGL